MLVEAGELSRLSIERSVQACPLDKSLGILRNKDLISISDGRDPQDPVRTAVSASCNESCNGPQVPRNPLGDHDGDKEQKRNWSPFPSMIASVWRGGKISTVEAHGRVGGCSAIKLKAILPVEDADNIGVGTYYCMGDRCIGGDVNAPADDALAW